jgi:hypothetical protein
MIGEHSPDEPNLLPFPSSLCHRCAAAKYVQTKTSIYVLCGAMPQKYPPQPVEQCELFRKRPPA